MPVNLPPHNILSPFHLDTLVDTVVRGDVLIGNSTPKWSRSVIGSAIKVLTSDGTDVSWQTPSSGAALSGLTAATGANTIANGDNAQVWNWATTTSGKVGMAFGETTASTSAGTPYVVSFTTLIGSTATPLNISNSLNGSQTLPTLSITPTWNTSGVATGLKFNVTNTASGTNSLLFDFQVGGVSSVQATKTGAFQIADVSNQSQTKFQIVPTAFNTNMFVAGAQVVTLSTAALNLLQSNAYITMGSGSDLIIGRVAAGDCQHGSDVNGAAVSQILRAANGVTGTDKTGGNFTLASGKGTGAGAVSSLIFQTPTVLGSGTTAQSLATRLTISSASVTSPISIISQNATSIPAGGTAGAGFTFSSTANYGIFFGSGAPSLSAAQGSLYLRSDGSTGMTRAYINTDGGTTWTGITTIL